MERKGERLGPIPKVEVLAEGGDMTGVRIHWGMITRVPMPVRVEGKVKVKIECSNTNCNHGK